MQANPDSGIREFFLMESGILDFGIQNPSSRDNDWNPVPGIHGVESRIQDCLGFPYVGRFTRGNFR